MITKQKPKGLRVGEGYTKLYAPYLDGKITFIAPYKGPGTYAELISKLDEAELGRPIFSQNSSLVYSAWETQKEDPEEKFSKEIISLLNMNRLACFTGIHYVPKKGAYIQDAPEMKDGRVFMEKSELVKRLEANDPSVRFVPFGYRIGQHYASKLEKNPFVIGLAGEEGAQKLAEVSGNYKYKPLVLSFHNVYEPITALSSLDDGWSIDGDRLEVDGNVSIFSYVRNSCAFGVFPKTAYGGSRNFSRELSE